MISTELLNACNASTLLAEVADADTKMETPANERSERIAVAGARGNGLAVPV